MREKVVGVWSRAQKKIASARSEEAGVPVPARGGEMELEGRGGLRPKYCKGEGQGRRGRATSRGVGFCPLKE